MGYFLGICALVITVPTERVITFTSTFGLANAIHSNR